MLNETTFEKEDRAMTEKLTPKEENALTQCFIFSGVDGVIEMAEHLGEKQRFRKNGIIYSPTHYQKSLGILLQGIALVEKNNGSLVLNTLKTSSCFGVAALFAPVQQYVTTIRAKTDCTVLFLSGEALEEMFSQKPKLCRNYIAFLSSRIQFLNSKIDGFTANSPEEKIILYLTQALSQGQNSITLPVSYTKLAENLNLSRSSLYRALDSMEAQGILRKEGRNLTLLEKQEFTPEI